MHFFRNVNVPRDVEPSDGVRNVPRRAAQRPPRPPHTPLTGHRAGTQRSAATRRRRTQRHRQRAETGVRAARPETETKAPPG